MDAWKPIDTAPKDGTVILLGHSEAVFDGWWDTYDNAWVDGETNGYGDLRSYDPTHWQPLPAPPKED